MRMGASPEITSNRLKDLKNTLKKYSLKLLQYSLKKYSSLNLVDDTESLPCQQTRREVDPICLSGQYIHKSREEKKICSAMFLDVAQAFDKV